MKSQKRRLGKGRCWQTDTTEKEEGNKVWAGKRGRRQRKRGCTHAKKHRHADTLIHAYTCAHTYYQFKHTQAHTYTTHKHMHTHRCSKSRQSTFMCHAVAVQLCLCGSLAVTSKAFTLFLSYKASIFIIGMTCPSVHCKLLECVVVCYSVLQRVAVCCLVYQCIAACCSVLQCVTVCYSVLKWVVSSTSVLQCVMESSWWLGIGSLRYLFSFAKELYKNRALFRKGLGNLKSLLFVATQCSSWPLSIFFKVEAKSREGLIGSRDLSF